MAMLRHSYLPHSLNLGTMIIPGDLSNPSNYRGITLSSALCKILELVLINVSIFSFVLLLHQLCDEVIIIRVSFARGISNIIISTWAATEFDQKMRQTDRLSVSAEDSVGYTLLSISQKIPEPKLPFLIEKLVI